jgi:hypothetical protein
MKDFTVVSCHFGSSFWIHNLIYGLNKSDGVSEIVVGHHFDQADLDHGRTELPNLDSLKQLRVWEKKSKHRPQHPSVSHATLLNEIVSSYDFKTEFAVILDSDMCILNENWLLNLKEKMRDFDVLLGVSHENRFLTHPCLMVFRTKLKSKIKFEPLSTKVQYDSGRKEFREDTGSRIGFDLLRKNVKVRLSEPDTLYPNRFFHIYLEGDIAHVGGQSLRKKNRSSKSKAKFYAELLHYELPKFFVNTLKKKPKWKKNPPSYARLLTHFVFSKYGVKTISHLLCELRVRKKKT